MKYRLEEIVDLKIGRTPPRKEQQWFNQGPEDWKWVSIKDMGVPGRYISKTSETISKDAQVKFNIPIVKKGTVILSFKLTVGRVAIVNEDMLTNEAIAQLPIKDTNMVRPLYLYYLLKNYKFDQLGSTSSIATAVNSSYLKKMEIEIPDIQEQDRVISILQSLDNELELNGNINDNLLQQAFALFDNQFSDITAGSCSVSDYILPKRGRGLLSKDAIKGDVPVVAGGLEPATYHNAANTASPVITISASGANAGFIRLWNIPVWSSDSSFIDSSITDFVYFWFVHLKKRQDEIYGSQTGSAQPHIYPQNIGALPICELDISKVKQYNDLVTPLFIKIGANESENVKLAHLRDTLLPKLMAGEVDLDSLNV